jgi:plasmid stability protein
MAMKTTLELPDELMRKLRVRAAESDRRLKDVVTEVIERGLEASNEKQDMDPLQAWLSKLEVCADGTVVNPDGLDAPDFERALEAGREAHRQRPPRDPFADWG